MLQVYLGLILLISYSKLLIRNDQIFLKEPLVLQSVGNTIGKIAKSNESELQNCLSYRSLPYIFEVKSSLFRVGQQMMSSKSHNLERPLTSNTSKSAAHVLFLPLSFLISVCFHAVSNIQLYPTWITFKNLFTKYFAHFLILT